MATGGGGDPIAHLSRLVRAAVEANADGACIAANVLLGQLGTVAASLLAAGLSVSALAAPLAERVPPPGGRLPHLSAIHGDERAAALELAGQTLAAGASVGATRALLEFGPVSLPIARAELVRRFARRECGDGE